MTTWIFLGVLALATFAVLGFYGLSISGWRAPEARTDLATPGHFVRMRGAENEIDLGVGESCSGKCSDFQVQKSPTTCYENKVSW